MREYFDLLAALTQILSVTLVLVLLLRPLLRRWCGALIAYASWALVPLVLAASLMPHPATPAMLLEAPRVAVETAEILRTVAMPADDASRPDIWLGLWLAGACAMAARLAWQQWRFVRSLGPLRPGQQAGVLVSDNHSAGPALVGLFRPRIVVPSDFEERYSATQQALILMHERIHWRRGDLYANAACSALQVVFWFHPLVHLAASCFRFDQELACDSAVLQRQPQARRSYADAILKTQLAASGPPLGCNWQSRHPLKGRIMNMTLATPHRLVRLAGQCLMGAVAVSACYSAWATATVAAPATPAVAAVVGVAAVGVAPVAVAAVAQAPAAVAPARSASKMQAAAPAPAATSAPASAPAPAAAPAPVAKTPAADNLYQLVATYSIGSAAEKTFRMTGIGIGRDDTGFRISSSPDNECEAQWGVSVSSVEMVRLRGRIQCRGALVAEPSMIVKVGEQGAMDFHDAKQDFKLTVLVSRM